MKVLVSAIRPTNEATNSSDGVMTGMADLKGVNPFVAVIGLVTTVFNYTESNKIMRELQDISA